MDSVCKAFVRTGVVVGVLLTMSLRAGAQCVGCVSDGSRCFEAQTASNYPSCNQPCYCTGADSGNYARSLHPGFTTRFTEGRVEVSTVVPGTAAERVGIRPGDELVLINGRSPSDLPCGGHTWESEGSRSISVITLRRAGLQFEQNLELVSVRTMLASLMRQRPGFRTTALSSTPGLKPSDFPGPYTAGLHAVRKGSRVLVTAVLRGSPAEFAGVSPGDYLAQLGGTPARELTRKVLSTLWSDYQEARFVLTIRTSGTKKVIAIHSQGLTSILRSLGSVSRERLSPSVAETVDP